MSEQITPNPSVPTQIVADGLKFPKFVNNLGIIPTSYKDSMSYYECLAWLCKYLEETVIPTVNQNGKAVEELQNLYVELNSYVTNYFSNLDVQEEINNKLDEMAEDGTLYEIIRQYTDPIVNEQNAMINNQNNKLDELESEINVHTSQIGNLVAHASDTGSNSELIDIRVGADGNTYSSAGVSVRTQIKNTNENIENLIKSYNDYMTEYEITLNPELFENGGINSTNGENVENSTSIRTKTYLSLSDYTRAIKTIQNTANVSVYLEYYKNDNTFIRQVSMSAINLPKFISKNNKIRLLIVDSNLTDIATTLSGIKVNVIDVNDTKTNDLFNIRQMNLLKTALTFYGDVNENGISYVNSNTYQYKVAYIPVKAGETYYMSESSFYSAFYNDDDTRIGGLHYYANEPLTNPFTVPNGATYLITTKSANTIGSSAYANQIKKQYYADNLIDVSVKSNVVAPNKPALISDIDNSVLNGKVINIYGDSISSTDYTMPYWGDIISTKTGCSVNNYGISGTTLAHTNDRHLWNYHFTYLDPVEIGYVENDPSTWSTGNCFCERFTKVDANADAIVIMGGTNDSSVPLGEWNSTNTATFYGALNVLFDGICKKMPGKKILVCTPIQTSGAYQNNVFDSIKELSKKESSDTLSLQLRAAAIKEKCNQYGLTCLDLYNDSGINGADFNKVYYINNDDTHPSNIGQVRLASLIQSKLEDLFRN